MRATDIKWDTDSPEDLDFLPEEIEIPEGMEDEEEISDYISDVTGFCHNGFALQEAERSPSEPKKGLNDMLSKVQGPEKFSQKSLKREFCK